MAKEEDQGLHKNAPVWFAGGTPGHEWWCAIDDVFASPAYRKCNCRDEQSVEQQEAA